MTPGWTPWKLPLALAMPLWIWVPSILGEYRWAILSAFLKPIPARHDAVVFPKFFMTNKTLELPYLPYDPTWAPLGENRSLSEQGSLCFQLGETGGCITLTGQALGMFDVHNAGRVSLSQDTSKSEVTITRQTYWQEAVWINGTFPSPNLTEGERPHQPRIAPYCSPGNEGLMPPWTDCQSSFTRWANWDRTFSLSPGMGGGSGEESAIQGLFKQNFKRNPFDKWVLRGVNGSCTDLNPFVQGGAVGKASFTGVKNTSQYMNIKIQAPDGTTTVHTNATMEITRFNKTLVNQTNYPPTPVCVYPPFLFILSNVSFEACSNDSCWMSQCWNAKWANCAMVARVPRWVPIPMETPSTLSLFGQKRDFGITAAIVVAISISAVAATAAGTALNQLSATVADAVDLHTSTSAQLKGGLMVVNQHLDLVEERLDILFQLAQLGCERKLGSLCITSVQYENFTRAANLSRRLSLYLAGNWSTGFDKTLESLRAAVLAINSTRVDLSLMEGLSSWISSAFSYFKEWVGVALFGAALCYAINTLLQKYPGVRVRSCWRDDRAGQ
eukprot:XP_017450018.1 PREDICTED: uncharacterized protein LOC108351322 isoform X1 [Rattus norvegicus]